MEDIIYWIWLSILNLNQKQKNKLLEIYKTPKAIYELSELELNQVTDSKTLIELILSKQTKNRAKEIFEQSQREKIKIISLKNSSYPKRLKNISEYPLVLYAKGNTKLLNDTKTISIIGSRSASEYGKSTTLKFSYLLSQKEYTIISGMAIGIDSYAHKGALLSKGKTIAVLGSGINYIYPKENEKLYNEILLKNGLIISEYPLNTKPIPKYFPYRNRIISGLADKVLVTEAHKRSGSIITATLGLEQGKDVYAIPGNITSYNSEGTNMLIKEGAFLVSSLEDIVYL